MRITAIDGSPKPKDSNTKQFIGAITKSLEDTNTIHTYSVAIKPLEEEAIGIVLESDVILLGFPLYVDGIPSNVLKQMIVLENAFQNSKKKDTVVYAIVNNGFYEGEQNVNAIEMVKHFCKRAGITFGQGIGIGTGEMQGGMIQQGMPVGKAVLKNLGANLEILTANIKNRQSGPNLYVRPNFPWHGFQFMGDHTFWKAKAKKNGISVKDMKQRRLYKKA
ncbi:MAG: hypothetical protein Q4F05_15975 [bacterium]|nr:hypothetical protein [bacterium]